MTKRAKVFAEAAAEMAADNVCHIYCDGYVCWVAMGTERMLSVVSWLRQRGIIHEVARSDDGMYVAWVLPDDGAADVDLEQYHPDHSDMHAIACVLTDSYADHRRTDDCRIDFGVGVYERAWEATAELAGG